MKSEIKTYGIEEIASDHDPLSCMDCRKPYATFPLDSTLPNDEWALIHDSDGGILCANCMVARIKDRVPGAVAVRMMIDRRST